MSVNKHTNHTFVKGNILSDVYFTRDRGKNYWCEISKETEKNERQSDVIGTHPLSLAHTLFPLTLSTNPNLDSRSFIFFCLHKDPSCVDRAQEPPPQPYRCRTHITAMAPTSATEVFPSKATGRGFCQQTTPGSIKQPAARSLCPA